MARETTPLLAPFPPYGPGASRRGRVGHPRCGARGPRLAAGPPVSRPAPGSGCASDAPEGAPADRSAGDHDRSRASPVWRSPGVGVVARPTDPPRLLARVDRERALTDPAAGRTGQVRAASGCGVHAGSPLLVWRGSMPRRRMAGPLFCDQCPSPRLNGALPINDVLARSARSSMISLDTKRTRRRWRARQQDSACDGRQPLHGAQMERVCGGIAPAFVAVECPRVPRSAWDGAGGGTRGPDGACR